MNSRSNNLLANIDWISILLYMLLVLIGWLNIYAAVYDENHSSIFDISQKYGKQLIWIGAAFVLAFLVLLTDSKFFTTFSMVIYGIMIFLLIAVLFFGTETKGARSWFEVGDFRIQPAEFAKFATNLAIAYVMSRHNFKVMRFSSLVTIGVILALPAGLIILQNDTGSALVYSSFILVLFREGLHGSILLLCFVAAAIFIMALLYSPFTVLLVIIGGTLIAFYYYRHDIRELFQIILFIGGGFALFEGIKWIFHLSISDYYMLLIVYVAVSGLWHGAALTFIVWGLLNGLYQVVGGVTAPLRGRVRHALGLRDDGRGTSLLQIAVTFALFSLSMVFFKAGSLANALEVLSGMVHGPLWAFRSMGLDRLELLAALFGLLVLLLVDLRSLKRSMEADYLAVGRPVRWLILLLLLFSIVIFGSYGAGYDAQAFIYGFSF